MKVFLRIRTLPLMSLKLSSWEIFAQLIQMYLGSSYEIL